MSIDEASGEPYASSHNWARLDEGRDLSELQRSHKSIEFLDLAQKKNLQFHQRSELGEQRVPEEGDDELRASYFPADVPMNHPGINDGIRALTIYEDYHRSQHVKHLKEKRGLRWQNTMMPNSHTARIAPTSEKDAAIKTKME